ncbi:MAG: tRNA guanosine(34) transglycosylase Tgt [Phycisphaerae bacterium]|nr:tRNA guanosine(34) transglycosylase Tgt [Phycisphaerae bacterium]
MAVSFEILARASATSARLGRLTTPHGAFETPAFMPVATAGAMKGLTPSQVRDSGARCILNNAYHLMLRPGAERVRRFGGVHSFMRWDGPILTDSGGFQAFSMSAGSDIDENGVTFRSFVDGSRVHLGPESSMRVQNDLGADIIMAFDDCPPADPSSAAPGDDDAIDEPTSALPPRRASSTAPPSTLRASRVRVPADAAARRREATDRTSRWLHRCIAAHRRPDEQALFGIVQGGTDLDLRRASIDSICDTDLPGYAIGGVAVGEPSQEISRVVRFTAPLLPESKPRYLMGVGYERDLVMAVESGVDLFDCVLPTRSGRNALVFTRTGPLRLRNAAFADDAAPIDETCDCEACRCGFGRGYLRHLFLAGEMLGPILASMHNLRHYQRLLLDIRSAIRDDAWSSVRRAWPCSAPPTEGP